MVKNQVCTYCFTFNHSSYIKDTMNGFVMQETEFPFVMIISDDASTDGEQNIIRQYLATHFLEPYRIDETDDYYLLCAQHRLNKNCTFIVFLLKYNHFSIKKDCMQYFAEWLNTSKYHALCEGDDFWIDSSKLQKQYDIMESHPEYTMCCHNAIKLYTGEKTVRPFNEKIPEGKLTAKQIVDRWMIPTASMFYRGEYTPYPKWMAKIYSGDMALYLRCLKYGPIYYLNDIMSIYRINYSNSSVSATMKGKEIFVLEQQNILLDSFNKGSDYMFNDVIRNRIEENKRHVAFLQKIEKNRLLRFSSLYFYQKCLGKIIRLIHKL